MKRFTFLLLLFFCFSAYCAAQNTYTEVVYLKNGSIIRGVVIEQVPNVSLKIKTADGSVFAYPMTEIERIAKEEATTNNRYRANLKNRKGYRGYKGFVDAGYQFDVSDCNASSLQVSTTHGYQCNDYIFVGAGLGLSYFNDAEAVAIPFFANLHANLTKKEIAPFADVKAGYSAGDVDGLYIALGLGVRFALQGTKAINLRLEYVAQGYNENYEIDYGNGHMSYADSETFSSFGFKVGFEF
ncbi:MAG: hypothetical protein RR365_10950 [Bacteroides sp.]